MGRGKREKGNRPKIEGVKLTGSESEWGKLPGRIQTLVKNSGLIRLSQIRNQIAVDAGLPMPEIYVAPYCWKITDVPGAIYGLVKPVPFHNKTYAFSVFISAATLIVVEDDTVLRKLLCHEFAHCFWYIHLAIKMTDCGKRESSIEFAQKAGLLYEEEAERDAEHLVDPKCWFGQWDADHFIFWDADILSESTEKIRTSWLNMGLPVKELNRRFETEGSMCISDEIIEHIRELEKMREIKTK